MCPKKRSKYTWMPPYCTVVNKIYVIYRPRIPENSGLGRDKSGFLKPAIPLGKISDPVDKILGAYFKVKSGLKEVQPDDHGTLYWITRQYFNSPKFNNLAPKTQKDHKRRARVLDDQHLKFNGKEIKLGSLHVSKLDTRMMQTILERRYIYWKEQGKKGEAEANHELRMLSSAISWAMRRHSMGIETNPCHGVEKIVELPVSRYVTDREFNLQKSIAAEVAGYLPPSFDIELLAACRGIEVREMLLSSIHQDGLIVRRRKGSDDNTVTWSHALHAAVLSCLNWHRQIYEVHPGMIIPFSALSSGKTIKDIQIMVNGDLIPLGYTGPIVSDSLIPSPTGGKLTEHTYQDGMRRLKKRMVNDGLAEIFWTAHNLKRKGYSEGNDDDLTGHKSPSMKKRYRVLPKMVKPSR